MQNSCTYLGGDAQCEECSMKLKESTPNNSALTKPQNLNGDLCKSGWRKVFGEEG